MVLSSDIFSFVHIDCHMETSNGAGIQPIKAARKIIPSKLDGIICLISTVAFEFRLA